MLYSTREVRLPVKSRRASPPRGIVSLSRQTFSLFVPQNIQRHSCSRSYHKSWRTSDRQETDTRGHRISFRRSLGTRSIRKGQRKRIVVARTSLPDGKRDPGRKLRKLAAAGARDYANSLTNVSCNQTAIYQSINSTNRTIYGHVAQLPSPPATALFPSPLFLPLALSAARSSVSFTVSFSPFGVL